MDVRYAQSTAVIAREIAGEAILVPIRGNVADLESIYTFNETAFFIWALIDGQRSVQDIRDRLVVEFEVEEEAALADLLELLGQLEAIGAIERT